MDFRDKPQLPGYEIIEKAGEGGMATVWVARQTSLDRIVAIKILSPDLVKDPEALERFKHEAQAAARLRHPAIVQVHDAGEVDGVPFFTMEYVPGCTVRELLGMKKRLSEKHALTIIEGVARALEFAWEHERAIHCDIKPDNIMIERDGTIKVADLGLARFVGSMAKAAGEQESMGTPNYASPEQARGVGDLDCRTDIYSAGAMLYYMLTGKLPFDGNDTKQILEKQLFGYLPDPQEINPELSSGTAWLIEKMMIKDRTLRTKDWKEVLTDIHEILHGGVPVGKMPTSGHSTVLRSDQRDKEPSATQQIIASEIAKREAAAAKPKQKIVLPKNMRQQLRRKQKKKRSSELARTFTTLLSLAVIVVVGYGIVTYVINAPEKGSETEREGKSRDLPPRSYVKAKPTSGQARAAPFKPTKSVTTPTKSANASAIKWKNADFLRGARTFNDALERYKKFQATKKDHSVLRSIEKDCRSAIASFEACRDLAPPEVNISHYINQCYRLISDCRQSMIIAPSAKTTGQTGASRAQTARAAKLSQPTARTISQTTSEAQMKKLVLAPTWKMTSTGRNKIGEDFLSLITQYGTPKVDLEPDPSLEIFKGVGYLMPLKQAADVLGSRASSRRPVTESGLPKNSFFYYTLDGKFEWGFRRLLLITDNTDRVVAAQLINESPGNELWFEPHLYVEGWHAYNFIQGKTKGNSKWKIAHRVDRLAGLIRIDSELVSNDPGGYFGLGQTRARVSLFLPHQIVNLIVYCHSQQIRKARR